MDTRKVRFYHCSPKRFKKGDTLICPHDKKSRIFGGYGYDAVHMNTSEIPHFTVHDGIMKSKKSWYVYEVKPAGKIYFGGWDDIVCESAEVIKCIGNAKGILQNYLKKFAGKDVSLKGYDSKCQADLLKYRYGKKIY